MLEDMSFGRLLRRASTKASDLLTFNSTGSRGALDGEIIFSKNNVCVHPAEPLPGLAEHHPGTPASSQPSWGFGAVCPMAVPSEAFETATLS